MADMKSIAALMKELYEGFVKLRRNDEEMRAIRIEADKADPKDNNADTASYQEKAKAIESEIQALETSVSQDMAKLSEISSERSRLEAFFSGINVNQEARRLKSAEREKITALRSKMDADFKALDSEMRDKISQSNKKYNETEGNLMTKQNVSSEDEYSKKALAFFLESNKIEDERARIISVEDGKISAKTESVSERVSLLAKQRDDIIARYAPRLDSLQQKIDAVYEKYEEDIENKQYALQKAKSDSEKEIELAASARESIENTYADQIAQLQSQFKKTDDDYIKQIRKAEREGLSTVNINTSRTTSLNEINLEIAKCSSKRDADLFKQDSEIVLLKQKHTANIDSLQFAVDNAIVKRDAEFAPYKSDYDYIQTERDNEVTRINNEINTHNSDLEVFVSKCADAVSSANQLAQDKHKELYTKMARFAMDNAKELDKYVESALAEFHILNEQKEQLDIIETKVLTYRLPSQSDSLKQRAKTLINSKDYHELLELVNAVGSNLNPPPFPGMTVCVGIALCISAVIAVVLFANAMILSGILMPIAVFVGLVAIYFSITSSQVNTALVYSVLADKYRGLQAIQDYAFEQAEGAEVSRLMERGRELFSGIEKANAALQNVDTKRQEAKTNIEKEYSAKKDKIKTAFDMEKVVIENETAKKLEQLIRKAENENVSYTNRHQDLTNSINSIALALSGSRSKLSAAMQKKFELDAKIAKLDGFEEYRKKYSEMQSAAKESIKKIGGQEHDSNLPDPLYFFGGSYAHEISAISEFAHGFGSSVLLYNPSASGSVAQSIESFMQMFLHGIANSTDKGLVKEQYIVDITSGLQRFDTAECKDASIYVVDDKSLEDVVAKVQENFKACKDSLGEHSASNFGELNRKLKEEHKRTLPCCILHIIVPERSQLGDSSKLLSSSLKTLIQNNDSKCGLIVVFYAPRDEWYSTDAIPDKNKSDDIMSFIRKLGSFDKKKVYLIDNQSAEIVSEYGHALTK